MSTVTFGDRVGSAQMETLRAVRRPRTLWRSLLTKAQVRFATVAIVVLATTAVVVATAFASTYAGPKTWLPGYDAASGYQTNWYADTMGGKGTTGYASRVAFIDPVGNWHWSYTDTLPNTTTFAGDNGNYRAYCKNNDTVSYVASCFAS